MGRVALRYGLAALAFVLVVTAVCIANAGPASVTRSPTSAQELSRSEMALARHRARVDPVEALVEAPAIDFASLGPEWSPMPPRFVGRTAPLDGGGWTGEPGSHYAWRTTATGIDAIAVAPSSHVPSSCPDFVLKGPSQTVVLGRLTFDGDAPSQGALPALKHMAYALGESLDADVVACPVPEAHETPLVTQQAVCGTWTRHPPTPTPGVETWQVLVVPGDVAPDGYTIRSMDEVQACPESPVLLRAGSDAFEVGLGVTDPSPSMPEFGNVETTPTGYIVSAGGFTITVGLGDNPGLLHLVQARFVQTPSGVQPSLVFAAPLPGVSHGMTVDESQNGRTVMGFDMAQQEFRAR